jgi:hypothetical protein
LMFEELSGGVVQLRRVAMKMSTTEYSVRQERARHCLQEKSGCEGVDDRVAVLERRQGPKREARDELSGASPKVW